MTQKYHLLLNNEVARKYAEETGIVAGVYRDEHGIRIRLGCNICECCSEATITDDYINWHDAKFYIKQCFDNLYYISKEVKCTHLENIETRALGYTHDKLVEELNVIVTVEKEESGYKIVFGCKKCNYRWQGYITSLILSDQMYMVDRAILECETQVRCTHIDAIKRQRAYLLEYFERKAHELVSSVSWRD